MLVRNLSQNGGRLVFVDHTLIPDEFDLMIAPKGDSRRAGIVWRDQANVGVQFLEYDYAPRSVDATREIRALKA